MPAQVREEVERAPIGGRRDDHLRVSCHIKRGPPETRIAIGGDFGGFDTDGWRVRVLRDHGIAELAWGGGSSALKELRGQLDVVLARTPLEVQVVKRIDLGA